MKLNKANTRERIKRKIKGRNVSLREVPKVKVFRSNKYTYVLILDDTDKVLTSFCTKNVKGSKTEAAKKIGKQAGEYIKKKKIKKIIFDRTGYRYHGRVEAAAEGLREAGVKI